MTADVFVGELGRLLAFFLHVLLYDRHASPCFFPRRCDLFGARLHLSRETLHGEDSCEASPGKTGCGKTGSSETRRDSHP